MLEHICSYVNTNVFQGERFAPGYSLGVGASDEASDEELIQRHFGSALKAARERSKRSRKDVARALGVHDKTLERWENGGNLPRLPIIVRIATEVGASLDDLLRPTGKAMRLAGDPQQSLAELVGAIGDDLVQHRLETAAAEERLIAGLELVASQAGLPRPVTNQLRLVLRPEAS